MQLCTWSIKIGPWEWEWEWEHLKSVPIQLPAGKACNGNTTVQFHSDQIRLLVSHETQLVIYDAFKMDHIHQNQKKEEEELDENEDEEDQEEKRKKEEEQKEKKEKELNLDEDEQG
ncbi:hypothetical protein RHGRI_006533 [Rhododendron griersonianum]|uniref:Uncharacterized protein n=1 Tax=Rhododendron griersonianum TaxID=479676 RepID=A0AAV6KTA8_9ERIC|nr:hypothetical protein RHGRI_006533 [Rhododendron griersonianum]